MYTEPHPINYRVAFLISIDGSVNNNNWIRVYPLDQRLESIEFENDPYSKQIQRIHEIVRSRITFPSRIDEKSLINEIKQVQLNWQGQKEIIYFPTDTVKLQVLEVGISPDYRSIISTVIYERQLCLEN